MSLPHADLQGQTPQAQIVFVLSMAIRPAHAARHALSIHSSPPLLRPHPLYTHIALSLIHI